ncbi:MAG: hypoxanthine phosphoribosyltransferase [Desulfobacteraceae bacterium]|jgi:hypoxanthine phosphoribosyltransferase
MPELIPILKETDIKQRIADISKRISKDYQDRELILIGVLKGSFIFLADLARQLTIEKIQIDFLRASSYGSNTSSSEKIQLTKDIDVDIKGKDVLIVEDIVDSGLTISFLIDHLKSFTPETIKICTLIDKKERRKTNINVDYACHVIEKGFIVGYGLDYAENYRNLPDIYDLKI